MFHSPFPAASRGLAVCLICALFTVAAAANTIVRDGAPTAEIIIREDATRSLRFAAAELQTHLEAISGARLPIVNTPGGTVATRIFVGESPFTAELGLSVEGLHHGAFRIESGDNWIALIGNDDDFIPPEPWARNPTPAERDRVLAEWDALTPPDAWWGARGMSLYREYAATLDLWQRDQRGSLNAVYALLRELGMRWYMPGEIGKVLPNEATIQLPRISRTARPDFDMRELWMWGHPFVHANHHNSRVLDQVRWQLWLGTSPGAHVFGPGRSGHGGIALHNREEVKQTRPEFYALWGGKRATEHLSNYGAACLSLPELMDENVRYARFMFDQMQAPAISAAPADGYTRLCECSLCEGKADTGKPRQGVFSNYVWNYVNEVAKQTYTSHPDHLVTGIAYGMYLLPPDAIEILSPNIAVGFCYWRSQFHDPAQREFYRDLRNSWLEITPSGQFFIWDYYLHGRPGGPFHGVPVYFMNLIADDIVSLKGISRGDYVEAYGNGGAISFNHLNCYVTYRMLWDADLDLDSLLEEFYQLFYGPAATEMKAFIEYSQANWPDAVRSVDTIDTMTTLLHAARKAAGESIYGERIQLLVDYTQALAPLRHRLAMNRDGNPKVRVNFRNRNTYPLVMDGILDDPFWESIPLFFHLKDPITGATPDPRTSFRARWADDSLFLGIRCQEPEAPQRSEAAAAAGPDAMRHHDHLIIQLETQTHTFYQFIVSPSGEFIDIDMKNDAASRWSAGAEVVSHIDDDAWSVEIHLPVAGPNASDVAPLNGIEGSRPTMSRPWFINVIRVRQTPDGPVLSSFSPLNDEPIDDPRTFGEVFTP